MKQILNKLVLIVGYIFILMWLVDFRLFAIFDLKMMLVVLLGSSLLTLSIKDKSNIKQTYLYQVTLTSLSATAFLYLEAMSKDGGNFIMPLQPLFYGIIYYVILSIFIDVFEKPEHVKPNYELTNREIAISDELLKGLSNKEIANKLFIAESTVKKHVQNIFKKVDVTNRKEFKEQYK